MKIHLETNRKGAEEQRTGFVLISYDDSFRKNRKGTEEQEDRLCIDFELRFN